MYTLLSVVLFNVVISNSFHVPNFHDPKKFKRKVENERYLPPFHYNGTIWPRPNSIQLKEKKQSRQVDSFKIKISKKSKKCEIFDSLIQRYSTILETFIEDTHSIGLGKKSSESESSETILIEAENCENWPSLEMKEDYEIDINKEEIKITASAEWGILRGLETFAQSLETSKSGNRVIIKEQKIIDFPKYPHRGLLIDTARHFLPISVLKSLITALSWNKMNVMHWHIVDQQSFPYQSVILPKFSDKGAYTQFNHVYSIDEIGELIEYARDRGVRIIPEFDTPGHTRVWGAGGGNGFLSKCKNSNKFGPIDPTLERNYETIEKLIAELRQVFKDKYVHIGGDEVDGHCWSANDRIRAYMSEHNIKGINGLQSHWEERVIQICKQHQFHHIVWEEVFTNGAQIGKDGIVQVWKNFGGHNAMSTVNKAIARGSKAILSAPWYFDWHKREAEWEKDYTRSFGVSGPNSNRFLGGEACIWTEYVDASNIYALIFPRISAVAERLWSTRTERMENARVRLHAWNCKQKERGLFVSPAIFNTNKGKHHLGYCRKPFDPFNQPFLF